MRVLDVTETVAATKSCSMFNTMHIYLGIVQTSHGETDLLQTNLTTRTLNSNGHSVENY